MRPTSTVTPTRTSTWFPPWPKGRSPLLTWDFGLEIVRLNLAAYLSAERGCVVDLTDQKTLDELETYVPLIQQGRGNEVLMK